MTIAWKESFKIGNAEIDAQCQVLFGLTNELIACQDWAVLRPLIVSLYKQMRVHFALEDALMAQTNFPGSDEHLAQHKLLLQRLGDRSMDVGKGHMNKAAIVAVMTEWAERHVTGQDAELAGFLAKMD